MITLTVQEIKLLVEGGVTALAAVGIPGCIYLRKRGINFDILFKGAKVRIEEAEKVVAVAEEVAPNNKVVDVSEIILKWTKEGVEKAQQLYHVSQLATNEERFDAAKETVYTALKEYNIEPTENQKKLIEDTIYAGVNKLGHKDNTESEKKLKINN